MVPITKMAVKLDLIFAFFLFEKLAKYNLIKLLLVNQIET